MATLIKDAAQIRSGHVRLIRETGHVIVGPGEALSMAMQDGLDLVLVQDGEIPVVKICDFAKIEYEKQKNIKHNRPKKTKCVQIGPHTHDNDLQRLAQKAEEFIQEGHTVILKMEVRGRDKLFKDQIRKKMDDFAAMVKGAKPGSLGEAGSTYTRALS